MINSNTLSLDAIDLSAIDIVGIDEVGYGAWAGPLYVCALQFTKIPDFKAVDSKSINHLKRLELYEKIKLNARWQIGIGHIDEINTYGLAYAYKKAIQRAVLPFQNEKLIIDGRKPKWLDCLAIVKGDAKVPSISAASIVAKVERDLLMNELAKECPEYAWANNKGYGTSEHIQSLQKHGFSKHHRTSYNIEKYLSKNEQVNFDV